MGWRTRAKRPWINQDPGWIEGFGFDEEGAKIDPRKRDGIYLGPSRGHIDDARALQEGAMLTEDAIRAFLKGKLASYKVRAVFCLF